MTTAEGLRHAADWLLTHKWCQHVLWDNGDPRSAREACAIGAILITCGAEQPAFRGGTWADPYAREKGWNAFAKASGALPMIAAVRTARSLAPSFEGQVYPPDWIAVAEWNNADGRTKDDVVLALLDAAAAVEAEMAAPEPEAVLA